MENFRKIFESEKIFEIFLDFFEIFSKIFFKIFDRETTKSRLFRLVLLVVFVLTQGKIGVLTCVCVIENKNNTGTLEKSHFLAIFSQKWRKTPKNKVFWVCVGLKLPKNHSKTVFRPSYID